MPINIAAQFKTLNECWKARPIGQVNGMDLMVMRCSGEFVWHLHEETDDCFVLFEGSLDIHLRDRIVHLTPGDMFVVPRGVEHKPVASNGDAYVLLVEYAGMLHQP